MGRARRHVQQASLQGIPEPRDGEVIMRVVGPRGSNIIEVESDEGRATLCILPAKFHKLLWLKRGNFVIVDEGDRDAADNAGNKVTGTISGVLYAEHVSSLRKKPCWPAGFNNEPVGFNNEARAVATTNSDIRSRPLQDNEDSLCTFVEKNTEAECDGGRLEREQQGDSALQVDREDAVGCEEGDDDDDEEDDDLPPLEENPNRQRIPTYSDSSESDEGEDGIQRTRHR